MPCVIELDVTNTTTISEPRTTTTATATFTRFFDGTAFGAYGTDGRCCRGCWHTYYVDIGEEAQRMINNHLASASDLSAWMALSLVLTFAGLETLRPPVVNVSVVSTSAVLKPSTTRSATACSAGFSEHATLWADG